MRRGRRGKEEEEEEGKEQWLAGFCCLFVVIVLPGQRRFAGDSPLSLLRVSAICAAAAAWSSKLSFLSP